jgi:hypothetical protein
VSNASHDLLPVRLPCTFTSGMHRMCQCRILLWFSLFVKFLQYGGRVAQVRSAVGVRATRRRLLPRIPRIFGRRQENSNSCPECHIWTKNRGKVCTKRRLQFFRDQEGLGAPREGQALFSDPSPAYFPLLAQFFLDCPICPARCLPKGEVCWCKKDPSSVNFGPENAHTLNVLAFLVYPKREFFAMSRAFCALCKNSRGEEICDAI